MRVFLGFLIATILSVAAFAQKVETPWQDAVTGQVEAMRAGDGAAALNYAGDAFQGQFRDDPQMFMVSIVALGYAPILASRSHSFGAFTEVSDTVVVQAVTFIGPDQALYEAVYQLSKEDESWRVQGVVLARQDGIAI